MHIFISAIYSIPDESRPEYCNFLWQSAAQLRQYLPNLHICCTETDMLRYRVLYPQITFYSLDLSNTLVSTSVYPNNGLPTHRNIQKDTLSYLILMNLKTEFIKYVKSCYSNSSSVSHFIWIDAGILKIIKNLKTLEVLSKPLSFPSERIIIPGPGWSSCDSAEILTSRIWWRYCGGLFIVPTDLVELFAIENHKGCRELQEATGRITWEVNVWTYLEAHGRIPITLYPGDHNDTIFNCLLRFTN